MLRTSKHLASGVLLVAAAAFLAGCAGASADTGSQPADTAAPAYDCTTPPKFDELTHVTVAAVPIVSNGALSAGLDEGFFEKQGLDLEIQPVAGIAAAISSVQGGTSNFGFAPSVSAFQAVDSGVPISIIAPFAGIAPGYYDKMKAGEEGYTTEITAIVTSAASGVDRPKDLEGKTVVLIDAKGQSELTTRYAVKADGGDPDKVNYTVMAFPDGLNAFLAGQVDAIWTVEPFLSQATDAGGTIISWPGVETFHEGPTSGIIASNDYINANRDVVTRMNCAIRDANAFANENPDAVRKATAVAQNVDPAKLANAVVPYFYTAADMTGLERFKDIMLENKFIAKDIDLETIVIPEALEG